MIRVFVIVACLGLAGCIMPPVLSYVSLALDGASFLATGKSVGDHALSAAVDENCAVLRVVTEQSMDAVCREYASEEERKAAVAPTVVAAFQSVMVEVEPGKVPPFDEPGSVQPVAYGTDSGDAATAESAVANRSAIYLMIGNFSDQDGAEQLAARVRGFSTAISPAMIGGALYFRVVAGPIGPEDTSNAQSRLAAIGIGNSWTANLCTRDLGAPPCLQD